ncbi:lipoprotein HlpB [Mannheimia varigena]|uniref:lipoprotein HlpB n=1 Tax=Mannheimia varigena TaxID=85404 RepID=UPI0015B3CF9F|nr:lipoprotein HlpB [Mannheimia varigena]QLD32539.1 lipoprotein HlpB [Mannheimia varigena]
MNKFTKISATALVALFLAACEKPAQKTAETAPAATTETQAATTAAKPAEMTEVAAPTEAAKADYQKLVAWNAEQEASMAAAQAELQQKLATQDAKQMQDGLSAFSKKVEDTVKSLDAVEVSDTQLKEFKEKTKSVLTLSNEVISEQVKALSNPSDEAAKQALQQKTQTLINAGNELQQLNVALQKRFAAK